MQQFSTGIFTKGHFHIYGANNLLITYIHIVITTVVLFDVLLDALLTDFTHAKILPLKSYFANNAVNTSPSSAGG